MEFNTQNTFKRLHIWIIKDGKITKEIAWKRKLQNVNTQNLKIAVSVLPGLLRNDARQFTLLVPPCIDLSETLLSNKPCVLFELKSKICI